MIQLLAFFIICCGVYGDVAFWADTITYEVLPEQLSAEGNVRLESQNHVLTCKKLVYCQQKLTAYDATLMEPDGSIIHAQELECDETFQEGFFKHVRASLKRDSTEVPAHIEAEVIKRSGGCTTDVTSADYTPCVLCDAKSPTWRIRSATIHHDQEHKRVSYQNAWLEVKNVPVLYTPYFSHPDPSVKRQSGVLFPSGGWSSSLGPWMRTPYFWDLGPDQDALITPILMTSRPPSLGAMYRRNIPHATMMLGGHFAPNSAKKKGEKRQAWHLQVGLRYNHPNDKDRFSVDVQRVSRVDDPSRTPFQSLYGACWPKDLVSQASWLHIADKHAIRSQVMTFQSDSPTHQPVVHPYINWYKYWPAKGWMLNGSFLSLSRKHPTAEYRKQLQRLSNELRYRKDAWIQHQNLTFTAAGRWDVYATPGHGIMQKLNPYASGSWRYPLQAISHKGHHIWGMQPTVLVAATPRDQKRWFPNEDSTDLEVDDTNFFMPNRLQGQVDRFDATCRAVTGVDHSWQLAQANSPRVNLFWGITQPFQHNGLLSKRYGVTRATIKHGIYQGRIRTLWQKSRALWNEYGMSVNGEKTFIPANYDVGLIRLSPQIMQTSQPLWQLSQQIQLFFLENLSVAASHVQDISTPKPYKRHAPVQIYTLAYQDDCAKFSFSIYRTPVGISPLLQDQNQTTQLDNTNLPTKVPTQQDPTANSSVSPYGQPVGQRRVDSGFMISVTFKNLGTLNPNSVSLPTNPSAMLAR